MLHPGVKELPGVRDGELALVNRHLASLPEDELCDVDMFRVVRVSLQTRGKCVRERVSVCEYVWVSV